MKKSIVIANGTIPKKKQIEYFQKLGYSEIICADGGANSALKLKITPNYIIGDMDSVFPETLTAFRNASKIIRIKRQNDTDVEKCLKYAIKKNKSEVVLFGATGDRLDHSFCNLGIVLKYFEKIKISVIHGKSILQAFSGDIILVSIPDETISLYGFDSKTKITSDGLKYPLNKTLLPFGIKESTSNRAVSRKIKLTISDGKIFVIRDFDTMRKNGLL
jgi:thiamine pyrophosphokinase